MQYKFKYASCDIGAARTVVCNGMSYPAGSMAKRGTETLATWCARLAKIGVQPVQIVPPDVDINTHDYGDPHETEDNGMIVISYPAPVAKISVWSTSTREQLYIPAGADVPPGYTQLAPPQSEWAAWTGDAWITDVDAARVAKQQQIVARADVFMDSLTAAYSEHEKLSWAKQEAEAKALSADAQAAVPLLSGIAATRGIPLDVLADRVLSNVAKYEAVSAAVLGTQQLYEDQLAAAGDDVDAITAIDPVYALPA